MENNQNKTPEEIKKQNRRFYASAGTIFLAVIIGVLWLANLPHVFSSDLKIIDENTPKKEKADFSQVRTDLNKIMQGVGEKFEKMKDQKETVEDAEVLLDTINTNASSSLATTTATTTASTSNLNILKK